jgi:hypothetical protein
MRKTMSPSSKSAPPSNLQPAAPQSAPSVQAIEQAHSVLTGLEVENRSLRAERDLLLKFAQLYSVRAAELATALKDLSRDLDLAKRVIQSTPAFHTFTDAQQAWLDQNVVAAAETLAEGFPRRLAYTLSPGPAGENPTTRSTEKR